MPRAQFSLKTMLWVMAVVGAFFAGAAWQHKSEIPIFRRELPILKAGVEVEEIVMPNGDLWIRRARRIDIQRMIDEATEEMRHESAGETGE
jgi:hypothetical protein